MYKSLESVKNQTFKNFEAIIINDGSTDNSLEIIEKFVKENENFILINQKNKGLSKARNVGLEISRGDYIAFLDSDDYIESNFLKLLYETSQKKNSDITCCNFCFYSLEKNSKFYMPFYNSFNNFYGEYTNQKALKKLILDISSHYYIWNKLYKRSLFFDNNIRFYDMYFEDMATCLKLFYYSKKIVVLTKTLYNYTVRSTSILGNINSDKINDLIVALGIIRNFLERKNIYKKYKNYLWIYSQKTKIVCLQFICKMHSNSSNFKDFKKNIYSAISSIENFVSNNYVPDYSKEIPELISKIVQPKKTHKLV
ncbi:MAG: glycosyltransferase group 2 family protein [Candidatus Paraimprobicoccus trichonymphae]|uniref:Glycosyltransferase group 2 family protein n=1 Tax=Candidatus Paraimprobicoccus trichonymphae TaxID=3033793 RepID=A0AA48KZM3_9FIRM|nr:MAG: glycosyltransferase group 2 family protein [Candidatus Paraimprobicoccus trichonymphae]